MDAVVKAFVIYFFILLVFRIAGRRTLGEMTAYDFVLLLIVGEATQQALLGDDFSLTTAMLVIATLVGIDIGLSLLKFQSPRVSRLVDGVPMLLVEHGQFLKERMRLARIDEADVLEAAREKRGVEGLDDIKYAVLEVSGGISVIPFSEADREAARRTRRPKQP